MLTLTPDAAEVVRQLAGGSGLEPDPGLRISPGDPTATGTPLNVEVTAGPEASDRTVDEGGAHVYIEPQVAEFLDDKVLDVAVEGSNVRFAVLESGPPDTAP